MRINIRRLWKASSWSFQDPDPTPARRRLARDAVLPACPRGAWCRVASTCAVCAWCRSDRGRTSITTGPAGHPPALVDVKGGTEAGTMPVPSIARRGRRATMSQSRARRPSPLLGARYSPWSAPIGRAIGCVLRDPRKPRRATSLAPPRSIRAVDRGAPVRLHVDVPVGRRRTTEMTRSAGSF